MRAGLFVHGQFDFAIIQFAVPQVFAKLFAHSTASLRRFAVRITVLLRRGRRYHGVEQALLRPAFRLLPHDFRLLFVDHVHGQIEQVAHHALDVPAVVADFGVA